MTRAEVEHPFLDRFARMMASEYTGQVAELAKQALQEAKMVADEAASWSGDFAHPSSMDPIGVRMRALRTRRRLTQDDLAAALGVPRSAVSHIEGGQRKVTTDELVKAASALGVSPLELLGIEEVSMDTMDSLCESGCTDPRCCDDCAEIQAELAAPLRTVEEVRKACVAAHQATTRLTTLVGPLWHQANGSSTDRRDLLVRVDSCLSAVAYRHASGMPTDLIDEAKALSIECRRITEEPNQNEGTS